MKKYWAISFIFFLFACQKHSASQSKPNVEVAAFQINPVCNGVLQGGLYVVDSNFEFVNQSYLKDTSGPINNIVIAFHWDFGDGSASSEKSPTHRYLLPGTYTATLITYLNNQPSDTTSTSLSVVTGLREYRMNTSVFPVDFDQAAQKGALVL